MNIQSKQKNENKKRTMRLFIWTNFAPDYTGGLAFAITENEKEARTLIQKKYSFKICEWGNLEVLSLTKKVARSVTGGS